MDPDSNTGSHLEAIDHRSPSPLHVAHTSANDEPPSPVVEVDPELRELYHFELFNSFSRRSSRHEWIPADHGTAEANSERDSEESSRTIHPHHRNASEVSTIATPKTPASSPDEKDGLLAAHPVLHPPRSTPKTIEIFLNSWIIWLLFITPIVFLVIWPSVALSKGVKFNLDSSALGGELTQAEAKGVDVLCSVVIAPLLVAAFDYAWFSAMRVVALNEQTLSRGTSLRALTTASSADSGSFNLMKTWIFLRSGRSVMKAFAALLLFSAGTKSLFANVVAYEAYPLFPETRTVPLVYLADYSALAGGSFNEFATKKFRKEQQEDYLLQFSNSFTPLSYQNASSRLEDWHFVAKNCTKRSLESAPANVTILRNVKGYRLSMNCTAKAPALPGPMFFPHKDASTKILSITLADVEDGNNSSSVFVGHMRGVNPNGEADVYRPFVLYNQNPKPGSAHVYIGAFYNRWNSSPGNASSLTTRFGRLTATPAANISEFWKADSVWGDPPAYMAAWGVQCIISTEAGHLDLQRGDDNTWSTSNSTWDNATTPMSPISLSIEEGEYMAPGYQWPSMGDLVGRVTQCSKGSESCATTLDPGNLDLERTINNTLYAIGEADRIFYDVVAQDSTRERVQEVKGNERKLVYRITYVPLLLLLGLISCTIAGSIPAVLLLYNLYKASNAFWKWQATDPVRLVVDAVLGLREEHSLAAMHGQTNETLSVWGKHYGVKFVRRVGDKGIDVVLEPAGWRPRSDLLGAVRRVRRRKRSPSPVPSMA